ncbi:MAG: histone H1-like repetitive region-containing protein [Treponema sp.]|uniref:histone H1-like repetitive region-containing protein n=1 Tax=Treponema sp. TaxID=166 RepID=UPI00298E325D|nr:histone H1-like repetitive region-containing protein [Treponema sp.]MCR5386278.1 histone H1-like repetitive region-containing protein [Treponema sp.]
MNISYNEFHINKQIRDKCQFSNVLYSITGNVVISDMKAVRVFTQKLNEHFDKIGLSEKRVSAGSVNAMGLIDEIFHYCCGLYRKTKMSTAFSDALKSLDNKYGKEKIDELLLEFTLEFPPVEVYNKKKTAEQYLGETAIDSFTGKMRSNRESTFEEMIMLHLENENPAFLPFSILFNDQKLSKNPLYQKSWADIQKHFTKTPVFGPFNHDFINFLREPMVFSPTSLKGQLEYIQKNWMYLLGEWLKRLLAGLDVLSEEEKAAWHGTNGGDVDLPTMSFENLMNEYERFSADSDWMPKVVLMAKTVLVWLDQLSKKYGRAIERLDQIPDEELDALRDEGFTGLWLIGLWERSNASKRIKQICGNPEAAASAYSLMDYEIAQNLGGWGALENLRGRLWQRGIRLASDMVPNHTGMDGRWVIEKPDLFIQRRDNPFPQYSFNGENLSHDSRVSVYLEDHYYSKNDCAVVFKRVDNYTGDTRYIYHGNDGTGMPWNDTAQIDFLNPKAREEVIQEILHVARNFPIIRFDAAMVLAKKHIRRLWYPEPGHGGDIATRSETGLSTQQFNDAIPNEFWREVVDRVAKEVPDTLLLAEAFWMMEGYFVRTLGMHRVYNSAFMNMLKKEENQKYRDTVKNTIKFDPQILKRYVNFMNNPDEETAVAQFGKGDKYFGVCTLMVTMPGLPMFGHGQIEGFEEKYGMEYTKAYRDEKPDQELLDRHWHDIFPLMKKRYLFSQSEDFLFYDVWDNGHVNENVFAYSNRAGNERAVVFYNNKYERASGWIKQSCEYAVKDGENIQMRTRTIADGLGISDDPKNYLIFREQRSDLWYVRRASDICRNGLFLSLNGFESQVMMDIMQVRDTADKKWSTLCDVLNGRGCYNLDEQWDEIRFKDLYSKLNEFIDAKFFEGFKALIEKPTDAKADKFIASVKKRGIEFYKTANVFAKAELEKEAEELLKAEETSRTLKSSKVSNKVLTKKKTVKIPAVKLVTSEKQFDVFAKTFKKMIKLCPDSALKSQKGMLKTVAQGLKDKVITKEIFVLSSIAFALSEIKFASMWSLSRKTIEFMKQNGKVDAFNQRWNLDRLYLMLPVVTKDYGTKIKKTAMKEIAEFFMQGQYAPFMTGANNFNGVTWFNKEAFESAMYLFVTASSFVLAEAKKKLIFELYEEFMKARDLSEYKCSDFCEYFSESKKSMAKKTAVKKATVKKTGVKKTAAKKTAAKKSGTKAAAKKATVKKSAATKKSSAVKKTAAKKTAVKKVAPKKTVAKKTATKKPAVKKSPAKKTAAKKPAVKKPAVRKTRSKK